MKVLIYIVYNYNKDIIYPCRTQSKQLLAEARQGQIFNRDGYLCFNILSQLLSKSDTLLLSGIHTRRTRNKLNGSSL
jgi:hypothetical protein